MPPASYRPHLVWPLSPDYTGAPSIFSPHPLSSVSPSLLQSLPWGPWCPSQELITSPVFCRCSTLVLLTQLLFIWYHYQLWNIFHKLYLPTGLYLGRGSDKDLWSRAWLVGVRLLSLVLLALGSSFYALCHNSLQILLPLTPGDSAFFPLGQFLS